MTKEETGVIVHAGKEQTSALKQTALGATRFSLSAIEILDLKVNEVIFSRT